jgi:hypothetical protein
VSVLVSEEFVGELENQLSSCELLLLEAKGRGTGLAREL